MNILVTGAKGFVGKNLCEALKNVRDGKNRTVSFTVSEIFEYDIDTAPELLDEYCRKADFVFNLAGVNRPQTNEEFMQGNFGFASLLLDTLKKYKNKCPIMLSSSAQASLTGRFSGSEYGKSKKAGEDLFIEYGKETGAKTLIYRFPNLFGKWCRPNYNSAVATFCNNVANDLPIQVNDRNTELELVYIDDLVKEMFAALTGDEHRCEFDGLTVIPNDNGKYCFVPVSYKRTLGEIVDWLYVFKKQPEDFFIPNIPSGSFEKKLFSAYLSYLPASKMKFEFKTNTDQRGSFTELFKTPSYGQVSVNISKPGIVKGEHWHDSKWEMFVVVKGRALIRERKIGSDEIIEFEVSGDKIEAVYMLPGYTHNIINLSDTEDLITIMWANETFDKDRPDTFYEKV
ncbi:MAG: NAD-dependent epimerase/dehydratase family protein [Clostridia bacterium]|nr:NAD-dependent epimerase/dehydratase family protein [Clostridia bacterium]